MKKMEKFLWLATSPISRGEVERIISKSGEEELESFNFLRGIL